MNDPTEDGGGPAGVVEGFEGRPPDKCANILVCLWPDPGVEGAIGLDEAGTVHDMMAKAKFQMSVDEWFELSVSV